MNKLKNITLLNRFMKGDISSEEKSLLAEWLNTDVSYDEIAALYQKRWQETRDSQIPPDISMRMFRQIKRMIAESERKKTKKPLLLRPWQKYAASIALAITIGLSAYLYRQDRSSSEETLQAEVKEYVINADKGQKSSMTLPDGTKIWLNSYTRITYSSDYGISNRTLSLTGEAYFEVAKDPTKRFIVKAGEMEVEALGTAFNVKAYNEDAGIVTTLLSGSVQTTVAGKTARLAPNQSASFNRENKQLSIDDSEDAADALMWRKDELVLKNQTLEEIAVILNRLYNVEIILESEAIKKHSFSGIVKNNSLKNVIETIGLTAPVSFEITADDKIILREKK
ncbi:MAG: FecR domain-containing protein [Tannerella sp.]|jgi:ferric-dicitrate binding protein FerR (iron transport regulator)|nr:FecR domain-containing protein [Tannerella sp.]